MFEMSTQTNPRRRSRDSHPLNSVAAATASLLKGATFHSPTSTSSAAFSSPPLASPSSARLFVPPSLGRSHSDPDDVIDAHRRRAALVVSDIDKYLNSNAEGSLPRDPGRLDDVLPVPRLFLGLNIMDTDAEGQHPRSPRQVIKPNHANHDHASDSGLGTSIASTKHQQGSEGPVVRSAAITTMHNLPGLSKKAFNRIQEHILKPLHSKPSLKGFEPLLLDVPRRIRERDIVCLRDLEKTLCFNVPETTKSCQLYLDFCLTSIRCVQATVEYLNEREQVRPGDRPYTNGYFVDLKGQIIQYASQLAAMKAEEENAAKAEQVDIFDLDPTDEVRLYGGLSKNGRPAELIRVKKDGRAFSLATGEEVDLSSDGKEEAPYIRMKRSLSVGAQDEEDVMRSMARRKKNALPEELIPRVCTHHDCGKKFTRDCDLRKHQKTHLRPWKCKIDSCKYSTLGWPTEKELDRHFNDKHSDNPAMYNCNFAPCPYKSKRESNCKQHMEKVHNWVYVRQKTNGKKSSSGSVHDQSLSPVSNCHPYGVPTPPSEEYHYPLDYPTYPADQDYMQAPGHTPMTLDDIDLEIPHQAPSQYEAFGNTFQAGSDFIVRDELYAAPVHIPTPPNPIHFGLSKIQPIQVPTLNTPICIPSQSQPTAPYTPPHHASFSPHAEANAMLYTPISMQDDEFERFDINYKGEQMPGDFQLFPTDAKTLGHDIFDELPDPMFHFSELCGQEMFPALTTHLTPDQLIWNSPQRPKQQSSPFQQTPLHSLY